MYKGQCGEHGSVNNECRPYKETNCPASDYECREVIHVGGDYRTLN